MIPFFPEAEFMNVQLRSQTWGFLTSFVPLWLKGGPGGIKSVVEVTVNSNVENYLDLCPNYIQEFDIWKRNNKIFRYTNML